MAEVSGKKIVPLLYGAALLLCGALLWFAKIYVGKTPGKDGVPTVEAQAALQSLPSEWTRITFVKGQGWVIYVPCGSGPGALHLETSERPRLVCEYCDSLTGAAILGFAGEGLGGQPDPGRLRFDVDNGEGVTVETAQAGLAERFPGIQLPDYILTWKLSKEKAMYFVPALQAGNFETLRAEDESPEGCLPE